MTRVLLADDHGVVLHGLRSLLSMEPEFEVAGTCIDGLEVVEFVTRDPPDVLVMDLKMPRLSGLDALARMRFQDILPPSILIAASATAREVARAVEEGAWGVIMKDQAPAVILESIHALLGGEAWTPELHPDLGEALEDGVPLDSLTEREAEVTLRAARGSSNKAIARELGIAVGTVKAHLHRAYRKLDISNRVQLALWLRGQELTRPMGS